MPAQKALEPAFKTLAFRLQEVAAGMSHGHIRATLQSVMPGEYDYVHDVNGDDKSGDVVFSSKGKIQRAGYKLRKNEDGVKATIDHDNAVDVTPRTVYESAAEITARESGDAVPTDLKLCESAATLETIVVREAKADYEIKLIAPGKGSSAIYPAEVLKRDGPKVFGTGTKVYVNHPTAAEEAARPEGDVKNLAGVLTTQAVYHENHAKGPGLYARMKVFADHSQMVEEKAAHVGMSIRASGIAEAKKHSSGLPVLKELTHAESVDIVTQAGAGGMIFMEAARPQITEEVDMTAEEIKALVESSTKAAVETALAAVQPKVSTLEARALRGDAMVEANRVMGTMSLHEAAKQRVIEVVTREGMIPVKDGAIDTAKFTELVTAEAKREGAYVAQFGGGRVLGLGATAPKVVDEAETKRLQEARINEIKDRENVFGRFGMPEAAAKAAANREAA